MNARSDSPVGGALDRLLQVGTVRGVCLARRGNVLVNRFPFADHRLATLCMEMEAVLQDFSKQGRKVDRMIFGFDGGHLVLLVKGGIRLLMMHLIPDEADFIAKAGRAFLADFGQQIAAMAEVEIKQLSLADRKVDRPRTKAKAKSKGSVPVAPTQAAVARGAPPVLRNEDTRVVTKPVLEPCAELPLQSVVETATSTEGWHLKDLLAASRKQVIPETTLLAGTKVNGEGADPGADEEARLIAEWAAEHLDLSGSVDNPAAQSKSDHHPAKSAGSSGRTALETTLVGAVVVQPVRLAARQPMSTLPPPKKPRFRR